MSILNWVNTKLGLIPLTAYSKKMEAHLSNFRDQLSDNVCDDLLATATNRMTSLIHSHIH